jgi:hypothetical protein
LDEYDSDARWYYPAIMRTTTPDPLAEKYYDISPYAWCANNPVRFVDPDGMDWYSYDEEYEDENGETKTRTQYKYVEGQMSKKEMKEGGYTHLGKTYDDGNGTYFSLGGSQISYDKDNALNVIAINRLKSADNTIVATIDAFSNTGEFWDNYKNLINMGTDAAIIISEYMDFSKGFKSSVGLLGSISGTNQLIQDFQSFRNGSLKGVALNNAIINLISLTGGAPGSALSLYYNTVAKPGAKAIIKLDQNLKNYIINTVIRSNNGMY